MSDSLALYPVFSVLLLAQAGPAPVEHPFAVSVNVPVVQVTAGGKPAQFILDTGAGTTVVDAAFAEAISLRGSGSMTVSGAGLRREARLVESFPILLPGAAPAPVPAVILPLETLSRLMGRRIDGILGFHFLRQFVVELDYDAARVRLHPPGAFSPPASWRELEIELEGGRPAVKAKLRLGSGPPIAGQFVLDTGSNAVLTLLPDFAARHQLPPRSAPTLQDPAFGVAGASPAVLFAASQFLLGDFEIAAPPVRVRKEGAGKGDGLIGGAALRGFRFAIDYRRRKLYLGRGARFGDPTAIDLAGMRLVWEGPEFNQPRIDGILPGRAAERAGLRAGDAIESLAGIPALKLSLNEVAARLRVAGSAVPIIVRRGEHRIETELRLLPLP